MWQIVSVAVGMTLYWRKRGYDGRNSCTAATESSIMFVSAAIARESNPDPINHLMRGNFPVNYEKKPNAIVSASKTVVSVGKNSFKLWNFTGTLSGF